MKALKIYNHQSIAIEAIPVLSYSDFYAEVIETVAPVSVHCVSYFGYSSGNDLHFICCLADDSDGSIHLLSWKCPKTGASVDSLTEKIHSFYIFEREIHENFGIEFKKHPWLKPLRYAWNRHSHSKNIADYPFFEIDSEELHEVGVGPIHAGIIEPGHFRFLCNGERILHLEMQHGFQHRGVEHLFLQKNKLNQRVALSESIAGDTATGHSSAFAWLWETLCTVDTNEHAAWQRSVAMELERIAMHTGDLAAICTDVAYQLGNSVLGRLRTPMVNFMQEWCGNRIGKSLVRPFGTFYDFTPALHDRLLNIFEAYEPDYYEIWERMKTLPSLLSRLEKTGVVTQERLIEIGAVGMSARMSGLSRDIRQSHPYGLFKDLKHEPVLKRHGDVYSRTQLRNEEIRQSISYLKQFLSNVPASKEMDTNEHKPQSSVFAISLTEGWRGEICHCAVTDAKGELIAYKIKDPSMHNWLALMLAVRNNEISDFPINNKSFNLSYSGFDL
jgi:Ni,Fe-hydrogenase III large subunit/NADH:ubiquinone oxidoreductase subunit C